MTSKIDQKDKFFLFSETIRNLLKRNNHFIEEYFYYTKSCPLCKNEKIKLLFKQYGFEYYKCKNCSFIFSNPRLTEKGSYVWYNSDYYTAAMKSEHYIAEKINKYHSVSLNEFHFNKTIEIIKNNIKEKNLETIDIGCGSGTILHYLKDELGFKNVVGVDLNYSNIEFAKEYRDITIKNTDINDLSHNEKFDFIITTENIEHVSNPIKYLELIKSLCKTGTYLLITTPHNDMLATRLMGLSGDHFCAPNHQNYFNISNLISLLKKTGFNIITYYLDKTSGFDLYAFLKKSIIKREAVTAYPPYKAVLYTVYKWQKDHDKSVKLKIIENELYNDNMNNKKYDKNKIIIIKNIIKQFSGIIPIRFSTHMIVLAKYEIR